MANPPLDPPGSGGTPVPKDWWKSTQLWWNVLMGVYNVLDATGVLTGGLAMLALLPPPWGIVVQSIGAVLLRLFKAAPPIAGTPLAHP